MSGGDATGYRMWPCQGQARVDFTKPRFSVELAASGCAGKYGRFPLKRAPCSVKMRRFGFADNPGVCQMSKKENNGGHLVLRSGSLLKSQELARVEVKEPADSGIQKEHVCHATITLFRISQNYCSRRQ